MKSQIKNVTAVAKNLLCFSGAKMPYINVKVGGSLSDEQRKKICEEITKTMETVAGKPPSSTYVQIDEIPRNQWSVGGKLLSEK